jgi:hypothetical protein
MYFASNSPISGQYFGMGMDERLNQLKIWQFFVALDANEKRALHAILIGSARVGTNDVLKTFQFLESRAEEIMAGQATRGDLYRFLHGSRVFDINHFNKPISRLITRIKEFWQVGANDPAGSSDPEVQVQGKLRLMQKLELHGLNTEYDYEKRQLEALFGSHFFFEEKYRSYASWKKIELAHNMRLHPHEPRPELREMQIALRRQCAFDQLRIEAAIVNQQKMAADPTDSIPERPGMGEVELEEPIFLFYRTFITLQVCHSTEAWGKLKALFQELLGTLSQDLLADISSLLISHASRARNAGDASMQGELLRVYHQILDSGTLGQANWNLGAHLQNYLFLVGYDQDREKASLALSLADRYHREGKIHRSTSWLLKAIFEEFFGDKRKAYKYYSECLNCSQSMIETAVARSKQLVFDYDDRDRYPILPDYGHSYEIFLKRNIGDYPALLNHKNFVACVRILAAACYATPGSEARQKKIQRCRAKIEGYGGQPLLNKVWLLAQLDALERDK